MLKIVTGSDNPILRTKSEKILKPEKAALDLIFEMQQIVKAHHGLGLAAPQIGKNIRLAVLNILHDHLKIFNNSDNKTKIPQVLINPEVILFSKEQIITEEGCLSLPEIFGNVQRPKQIKVVYQDENFMKQEYSFDSLVARVIQHEVDHLNGILFIDKLSKV